MCQQMNCYTLQDPTWLCCWYVSFKRKNKKGFWFTSEKTTNLGARFHYQQLFWKLWQLQLWWWHRWWYTWWQTMILIDKTKKLYILLMVSDCFVHFYLLQLHTFHTIKRISLKNLPSSFLMFILFLSTLSFRLHWNR